MHSASTAEHGVQRALLAVAAEIADTKPGSAAALEGAARSLSDMAMSLFPPLASDDEEYFGHVRTFVDAAAEARALLGEEGEPAQMCAIELALKEGRDLATRLLRETPARIAFQDACTIAGQGKRVVFLARSEAEAIRAARMSPGGLHVCSRSSAGSIPAGQDFDAVITACKAIDAIRFLAEIGARTTEATLLLPPADAAAAGKICDLVLSWSEMSAAHAFCRTLRDALPPDFAHLRTIDLPFRRHQKRAVPDGVGIDGKSVIVICLEDGEEVFLAASGNVVVLRDGNTGTKRSADLERGDVVILLPHEVGVEIARELGWDHDAALSDPHVASYKERIAAFRNGPGAGLSARDIIARMSEVDPDMPSPSESTVRYWLAGGEATETAAPHASGDRRWLAAFAEIVGISDAEDLFERLSAHRARLQREGHLRSGLLEAFLFDPYDAVVQRGLSKKRAGEIRAIAMNYAREIVDVDASRAGERE